MKITKKVIQNSFLPNFFDFYNIFPIIPLTKAIKNSII